MPIFHVALSPWLLFPAQDARSLPEHQDVGELSDIAGDTPAAYNCRMFTFIESSILERVRPAYLDDDEYSELQQ